MSSLRDRYIEAHGNPDQFDKLLQASSEHMGEDTPASAEVIGEIMRADIQEMAHATARFTLMMANYMIGQGVDPDTAEYTAGVVWEAFRFNAGQLVEISGDLRVQAKHIREHHEGGVREGKCDMDNDEPNDEPTSTEKPGWWGKLFQ